MKRKIVIILLSLLGIGVAYSQGSYTIKGSVGKTHLKRVFLQLYSARDSIVKSVARIEPDGTFIFKGSLPEPRLAEIRIYSTSPKAKIDYADYCKVDVDDISNTRITGSYSNSQYRYILEECELKQEEENQCLENYILQNPESIYAPHILATHPYFALLTSKELNRYVSKFYGAAARTYYYRYLQNKVQQLSLVSLGQKMPDFVLPDTTSKGISPYDELKGCRFLVINFWSSKDLTDNDKNTLCTLYDRYNGRGVGFFSVSFDLHRDTWIRTINESNFTWKHASDLLGWESVVAHKLCIPFIPCNIIIDYRGNIVARDVPIARLEYELNKLLSK